MLFIFLLFKYSKRLFQPFSNYNM